jgi:hypothetical protein
MIVENSAISLSSKLVIGTLLPNVAVSMSMQTLLELDLYGAGVNFGNWTISFAQYTSVKDGFYCIVTSLFLYLLLGICCEIYVLGSFKNVRIFSYRRFRKSNDFDTRVHEDINESKYLQQDCYESLPYDSGNNWTKTVCIKELRKVYADNIEAVRGINLQLTEG